MEVSYEYTLKNDQLVIHCTDTVNNETESLTAVISKAYASFMSHEVLLKEALYFQARAQTHFHRLKEESNNGHTGQKHQL